MTDKTKLLIVDDDETITQCVKLFFSKDFDVHTSSNGYEAIKLQQEQKIKIVITDIDMPEMSGVELGKKLLEKDSDCQIFAISGSNDFLSNARNAGINFVDYFEKPFNFTALKEKIKQTENELLS